MIEITQDIATKVLEVVDRGLSYGMGKSVPGKMCVEAAVCYALGLPHGDDPECVSPALRLLKLRLNDSSWSSNAARARGLRRLAVAQLGSKDVLDDKEFVKRCAELAIRKMVPIALRAAALVQKDEKHRTALYAAADRCEKEGTREAALEARTAASDAAAADAASYTFSAAASAAARAYAADADVRAAYAYADADVRAAYADAAAARAYAVGAADADIRAAYADAYAAYADADIRAAYAADADADVRAAYADAYAAYAAAYAVYTASYAASAASASASGKEKARDDVLAEFAEAVVTILIDMKAPGVQWLALTEKETANG